MEHFISHLILILIYLRKGFFLPSLSCELDFVMVPVYNVFGVGTVLEYNVFGVGTVPVYNFFLSENITHHLRHNSLPFFYENVYRLV